MGKCSSTSSLKFLDFMNDIELSLSVDGAGGSCSSSCGVGVDVQPIEGSAHSIVTIAGMVGSGHKRPRNIETFL